MHKLGSRDVYNFKSHKDALPLPRNQLKATKSQRKRHKDPTDIADTKKKVHAAGSGGYHFGGKLTLIIITASSRGKSYQSNWQKKIGSKRGRRDPPGFFESGRLLSCLFTIFFPWPIATSLKQTFTLCFMMQIVEIFYVVLLLSRVHLSVSWRPIVTTWWPTESSCFHPSSRNVNEDTAK